MAFCTSCGASVDAAAATCSKCGAAMAGAVSATPAAAAAGTPPVKKGSSAVKIILMVLGVFFLLGALVVGGLIYGAYRVAESVKVHEEGGEARVETPFGTVEANKDPNEIAKDLDVEIYPGATPVREGSSSVNFGGMKATTAIFETSDSSQKVYEFYKEEFPKATLATSDGDKHTIMAGDRNDFVTIVIEEQGGKTRITIARTSK